MTRVVRPFACAFIAAAVVWPASSRADDADALSLQATPISDPFEARQPIRLHIEGAIGNALQRYGLASVLTKRLSIDYTYNLKLEDNWHFSFSNRLDHIEPISPGGESTTNSLREIYTSWRSENGNTSFEFGRINLRAGPSYGYNPTDYFRDGALRSVTSIDPISIRENRLGTLMLRYQQLWAGGAASVALAPKVASGPNSASFSPDFGATNHSNRALISFSSQFSDRLSGQGMMFSEQNIGSQIGANFTALLSDAMVGYFEVSRGQGALGLSGAKAIRNRVSTGLTYTTSSRLGLTAEYEYNGFAADYASRVSVDPNAFGIYLFTALTRQEIASRKAWLFYASQKSAFLKNLDITALMRINAEDNSRLGWFELRYHWPSFDGALQIKSSRGQALSEYGLHQQRQSIQVLGAWFF